MVEAAMEAHRAYADAFMEAQRANAESEDSEEAGRRWRELQDRLTEPVRLGDAFDDNFNEHEDLYGLDRHYESYRAERKARGEPGVPSEYWRHHRLAFFVREELFGFLQFFDLDLTEDHEENYYMEREWRIIDELKFRASDICRVLVPESYGDQLRRDRPELDGRIHPVP